MKTASISAFKDQLSSHIESAREGEPVLVTDRRRPVAVLQGVEFGALPLEIQAMVAKGAAWPGGGEWSADDFFALPKAQLASGLTSALLEEREES